MRPGPFTWREGNELVTKLGSERWLAQRIQDARKARGMSQAQLSKAMTNVGHPLHQSAISKIEAPPREDGPRSITIGEAIAFSKVFGIPLGELLLPPDAVIDLEAWQRFTEAAEIQNVIRHKRIEYENKVRALTLWAADSPTFVTRLRAYRADIMRDVEAKLRAAVESDRGTWSPAELKKYNRPPAVIVIDEVLGNLEEQQ